MKSDFVFCLFSINYLIFTLIRHTYCILFYFFQFGDGYFLKGQITTTKQMSSKVKVGRFVKQRVMNTDIGTL